MVRKITPTSGGWRKSFGAADHHLQFERAAKEALVDFLSNSRLWRDIATHKLCSPPMRRPLAPAIQAALRTFADELVELDMPALAEPSAPPREPIEAVA